MLLLYRDKSSKQSALNCKLLEIFLRTNKCLQLECLTALYGHKNQECIFSIFTVKGVYEKGAHSNSKYLIP